MRDLRQDVTHWTTTPDGFGGFTFGVPTALKGRWEDKATLFRDTKGEEVTSESVVYLDTDVVVGDYLFLGVSAAADPTTVAGARQIRQFFKTPDLRVLDHERKAFL